MSIWLIASTSMLFAFADAQYRHSENFRGRSQGWLIALTFSSLLGFAAVFGITIYYFFHAPWYWPILSFLLTGMLGPLVLKMFRTFIPEHVIATLGFVALPACAIWAISAITGIAP